MQLSMYSRGYSDILVYIGWADFFEVKVFYFNIFFILFYFFYFIYFFIFLFFFLGGGGGFQLKLLFFGLEIFVDIYWGSLLFLTIFGLLPRQQACIRVIW